ncbi:hypothetical protein HYH03_002722 [Edaphochlamys debaryana]|uniref:RAP domain-containing protein n=1 Tax=Edaphochlamys debaryana TaxID=47281 RepID=A0A835YCE7_9CHLO|nr:hypothetical protein HYH03_002722 [Edaphochlamys debaryana]|eukprot:KAG2499139.1 hypothetical protein HYH03_002722 [Edaphochlamys debaryana]
MGETRRMNAATYRAAKLLQDSTRSADDTALCHRILDTLVAAYQTMLSDGLRFSNAVDAIIPLHACAKAGYWQRGFIEELLRRLSARGGALLRSNTSARKAAWSSPPPAQADGPISVDRDVADLWWSLSFAPPSVRSSVDLEHLLDASAEALLDLEDLDAEACSRILHACARLGLRNERLAQHLTARLGRTGAAEYGPALANAMRAIQALTALAGAGTSLPRSQLDADPEEAELAAELAAGREGRVEELGAPAVGFSPNARSEGIAQDELGEQSAAPGPAPGLLPLAQGERYLPLTLANVLQSCASLECADPSIIGPLAEAAGRAAPFMTPHSLANATRALAKLGFAEQGVYAALAEAAAQPGVMQGAKPRDWADLWYALTLVRHRPQTPHLLARTADAADGLRHGSSSPVCASLLWSLAVLRLYDERLVDALASRLAKLLGRSAGLVTGSHLCVSLWALAVMGPSALSRHSAAAQELLREVARRWEAGDRAGFLEENLFQLQQAQAELEALGDAELYGILGAREGAGRGTLLSETRVTASRQNEEGGSSSMESAVVAALEELQQQLSLGVIVAVQPGAPVGQARVADVLVGLADGRRVAVEVDGPSHFLASHPQNPRAVDGGTKLRNRQLERVLGAGNVLSVPWWEWNALKKKRARRAYLCGLLGLETA